MAKKKSRAKKGGRKSKKSAKPKHEAPVGFWRQAFVYFVIPVSALLMVLGEFGLGGELPKSLFLGVKGFIGVPAYITPIILFLMIKRIYSSDEKKMPLTQSLGLVAILVASSGFVHALFIDADNSLAEADQGNGGGMLGHVVVSALSSFVTSYVAALILFVIALIALLYVLRIPIDSLFIAIQTMFGKAPEKDVKASAKEKDIKVVSDVKEEKPRRGLFGRKKKEEPKEEESSSSRHEFKLNEGVPLQRRSTMKNSATPKTTEDEDRSALTKATDPNWKMPAIDILSTEQDEADAGDVKGNAAIIEDTFKDFNIDITMEEANIGPRVTQYTMKPPSGVRLTKITSLENNLALNLAAQSIRIEAPIPGKRLVGIEVPNHKSATVRMASILESKQWKQSKEPLSFAIGRDIGGEAAVEALNKMPHLLVAGATGSGKSVMINTLLASLLYHNSPSDMKMILVDPKQVELTPYNDIPHLLTPVITEPEKCISALKWSVAEMERRYTALAEVGRRNIEEYNKLKKDEHMPYIVIVIDELADLMMLAARDVEALIVRLAQKSRAVGIHLVLATQRPSVDVITGLIKANVPARIAFTVASQVDSRTIIDKVGAEKLLGMGDMLMTMPSLPKPKRIQGVFIGDEEIQKITDHLRMQQPPEYNEDIIAQPVQINGARGGAVVDMGDGNDDSMYHDAVQCVIDSGKASASLLQRRLRVGYARAARLIESMEEQGIVGPADGARPREVLVSSIDEVFGGGADAAKNEDYVSDPNER